VRAAGKQSRFRERLGWQGYLCGGDDFGGARSRLSVVDMRGRMVCHSRDGAVVALRTVGRIGGGHWTRLWDVETSKLAGVLRRNLGLGRNKVTSHIRVGESVSHASDSGARPGGPRVEVGTMA